MSLLPGYCKEEGCERPRLSGLEVCASHAKAERDKEADASKPTKPIKTLQRGAPPKRVSDKRAEEMKEYKFLASEYLKEHPECEANLRECTGKSVEVHHTAKRGKNYLEVETFMAVCRPCHILIEQKMSAEERREQGFLIDVKEKPII